MANNSLTPGRQETDTVGFHTERSLDCVHLGQTSVCPFLFLYSL